MLFRSDQFGNIASFSSWGPNGAGLPKPDVVSVGQGTILIDGFGNVARGNGTSFSNPLLCGLIACLWQAFPEFTNREIMKAVKNSSSLSASPNYRFGYGIPDFQKAFEALENEREIRKKRALLTDEKWIRAYPVPYANQLNVILKAPQSGPASLQVLDITGRILNTVSWQTRQGEYYFQTLQPSPAGPGLQVLVYRDTQQQKIIKILKR